MILKYIATFVIMGHKKHSSKNKSEYENIDNLSFLGPVTDSIIDSIIKEIKKTKTKEKSDSKLKDDKKKKLDSSKKTDNKKIKNK